jgi:pre-mRNA 3'-end-processing factor FIP1
MTLIVERHSCNICVCWVLNSTDRPWRKPGADITDYFNYGFDEDSWRIYVQKQVQMRSSYDPFDVFHFLLFVISFMLFCFRMNSRVKKGPFTGATAPGPRSNDAISLVDIGATSAIKPPGDVQGVPPPPPPPPRALQSSLREIQLTPPGSGVSGAIARDFHGLPGGVPVPPPPPPFPMGGPSRGPGGPMMRGPPGSGYPPGPGGPYPGYPGGPPPGSYARGPPPSMGPYGDPYHHDGPLPPNFRGPPGGYPGGGGQRRGNSRERMAPGGGPSPRGSPNDRSRSPPRGPGGGGRGDDRRDERERDHHYQQQQQQPQRGNPNGAGRGGPPSDERRGEKRTR